MPASYEENFSVIDVDFSELVWTVGESRAYVLPSTHSFPADMSATAWHNLPATFDAKVQLVALNELPASISPGETLTFFTAWEVLQRDKGRALALFVHILNADGQLVAQQDGLGYPLISWQPGDRFLHVHHIQIGGNLPVGEYWIQLGIYERSDGQRWTIQLGDDVGDRLLVGSTTIAE